MSDREFDNYLTLLTKLLRLDNRQRERIASELRAHWEDRLDEMLARGVSREEAVKLALAEFGDAASLAAEFGSLSRNRRRRWLMRVTTFSAAAIVLVAAGLATFWPGRIAGPGAAAVVAQDPDEQKEVHKAAELKAQAEKMKQVAPLEWKLDQRIDAEFAETSLHDVLQFVEDASQIQFYVKRNKLDEVGVTVDAPVSKHLKQVRVRTLLDLMFEELGLTYYEKDDLIVITTPEDAESLLEIRVYDCRDLLGLPMSVAGAGGMPGGGFAPGAGALPPGISLPGGAKSPPAAGPPPGLEPPGGAIPGNPAIPGRGAGPRAPGAIPTEIMPQFGGAGSPPAAAAGGFAGPQPGAGGEGAFGGGVPGGGVGGMMGGMGMGGPDRRNEHEQHADALIDLITTNVDPESWTEVGGPGSISAYHGLIVVTQTARTHKKIERVLDMLREAAGLDVGGVKKVVR